MCNKWFCVCPQVVNYHRQVTYASSLPSFHMIPPACPPILMLLRRSCPSAKDRSSKYDHLLLNDSYAYFHVQKLAEIYNTHVHTTLTFLHLAASVDTVPPSVQVYGDKDADGFYRGESGGRLGYVPCNMVSEIQVEDEETRQQLLQQGFLSTVSASMEKIGM